VKRPKVWAPVLGALLVIGALAGWQASGPGGGVPATATVAVAARGPMVVSLIESGEVEAEKRKVISNECRWPVIIKEIVADGTTVKPGQTIVQFECKELLDRISQQRLEVTAAENHYIEAQQQLRIRVKELHNAVERAKQNLLKAREDLERYQEAGWPIELGDAENWIRRVQGQYALAKDKLEFKQEANANQELMSPYSENEIRADELEVERLEQELTKARSNLDMLKKFGHPQELRRLKWQVVEAEAAYERAEIEQETGRLVAEANEKSRQRQLEMQKSELDELLEDEKKLIIKAEKEGLVVYDTGNRRWWSSEDTTVAVGEKIEPRRQLMIIPDMTTLQVTTKVYEAVVDQVRPGVPAFIRLDARAGVVLRGTVSKVSTLPDHQNRWLNPGVKIFNVTVEFDEGEDLTGLKPGMSAQVELVLDELDDVLQVPVAAVFSEQEENFCWRLNGRGEAERTPVELGKMNDSHVQILSGLAAGDRVLLSEPEPTADMIGANGAAPMTAGG